MSAAPVLARIREAVRWWGARGGWCAVGSWGLGQMTAEGPTDRRTVWCMRMRACVARTAHSATTGGQWPASFSCWLSAAPSTSASAEPAGGVRRGSKRGRRCAYGSERPCERAVRDVWACTAGGGGKGSYCSRAPRGATRRRSPEAAGRCDARVPEGLQ